MGDDQLLLHRGWVFEVFVQQALAGVLLRGRFADGVEQPGLDFVALVEGLGPGTAGLFQIDDLTAFVRGVERQRGFSVFLFALASDLGELGIADRLLGQLKARARPDGLKLFHVPCMMTFAPALAA